MHKKFYAATLENIMDPLTSRWAEIDADRRSYMPTPRDPTEGLPRACGGLRVRREYAARDAINHRAWDNFHATPPTQVSSEELRQVGRPVYQENTPINCRTSTGEFRAQINYTPAPSQPLSANPYLQRLDASGDDSRNIVREMRAAVVEDNRERQIDADRQLAQRQFYDRWLPAAAAVDSASLNAYELLRPKFSSTD